MLIWLINLEVLHRSNNEPDLLSLSFFSESRMN